MTSRTIAVAVDCTDVARCVEFWSAVFGTTVERRWTDGRGVEYVEIGTRGDALLLFQPVGEGKRTKNRLHLDVAPIDGTQPDEVARLVGLGATVLDDDPQQHWVVLADTEGNEFCVLPPRPATGGPAE